MEIGTEKIIEAYSGASPETVGVLNRMLGTEVQQGSLVKTFDEAVAALGSDNPAVRRYRRKDREGDTETEAFERLRVVTEAVNRFYISVSPPPHHDLSEDMHQPENLRWYPVFWFYSSKEEADMERAEGEVVFEITTDGKTLEEIAQRDRMCWCVVGAAARDGKESLDGTSSPSLAYLSREGAIHSGSCFSELWFKFIGMGER